MYLLTASRKISNLPDAITGYWFRCIGIKFDCIAQINEHSLVPMDFFFNFFFFTNSIYASNFDDFFFACKVPISNQNIIFSPNTLAFTWNVCFRFFDSLSLYCFHENVILLVISVHVFTLHFLWMIIFSVEFNWWIKISISIEIRTLDCYNSVSI